METVTLAVHCDTLHLRRGAHRGVRSGPVRKVSGGSLLPIRCDATEPESVKRTLAKGREVLDRSPFGGYLMETNSVVVVGNGAG